MNREIENSNNIAETLFKDPNGLKKDNVDFITGIKNFQIYTIKLTLTKLIIKCERDHIFSYLMNENNDEFLKTCFDEYFDKLDLGDEKPSLEMNSNDVEIIMGMNIPGIKPIFENVIQYVNDLKEEFFDNEDYIRNNRNEGEELEKDLTEYSTKQERLINNVVNKLKKNEIFIKLEEMEKENQLNHKVI